MRILIVTDISPHARETLRFWTQLLPRSYETPVYMVVVKEGDQKSRPDIDTFLSSAITDLGDREVQTKVKFGSLAEETIQETQSGDYDLVILREEHIRNSSKFFTKSDLFYVLQNIHCSVLIAKSQLRPIRRILICDSGADHKATISRFTAELADLLAGEEDITVLHVMSQISAGPGVVGRQLREDANELMEEHTPEGDLLERDVNILQQFGFHPTPKVRHGLVVDEILDEAQKGDYDLVTIGYHFQTGWEGILLENIFKKIVMKLDRPVLVVK